MRALFLFLSRQKQLRRWTETSRLGSRLSSRFIAGHALSQSLAVVRRINTRDGLFTTLDCLGESITSLDEAAACRDEYLRAVQELSREGLEANVSLKLTQFGLDLSEPACLENVGQVVEAAARVGGFVRIDMESSAYTGKTLDMVRSLHARYGHAGAVIQAYLLRSADDIEDLCARRIRVRLCKGAYLEPADVAFQAKRDVDANYVRLMKRLLEAGAYPALATHDEAIIRETCRHVEERRIDPSCFEFQMLYGVRRDLQSMLAGRGFRVRIYVPYGDAWYPYVMRRLAERPANVWFLVRNLFR